MILPSKSILLDLYRTLEAQHEFSIMRYGIVDRFALEPVERTQLAATDAGSRQLTIFWRVIDGI